MNEEEGNIVKNGRERSARIYKTFICMDNTYGKQTRAFDKLGCALSGHRAYNYGCCPSRLTALFARLPIQPISLPSFAPQSSSPIVNYQSIIDRARLEEYPEGGIERLRAVDSFGGGVKGGENDGEVNKRGEERGGGGWSSDEENFHRFEFGKRKRKKGKKRRSKNRIG